MKQLCYNFPETKFASENTIIQQLDHLKSEVNEAKAEYNKGNMGLGLDEAVDAFHSAETLVRKLVKVYGREAVLGAFKKVIQKNEIRGYYKR